MVFFLSVLKEKRKDFLLWFFCNFFYKCCGYTSDCICLRISTNPSNDDRQCPTTAQIAGFIVITGIQAQQMKLIMLTIEINVLNDIAIFFCLLSVYWKIGKSKVHPHVGRCSGSKHTRCSTRTLLWLKSKQAQLPSGKTTGLGALTECCREQCTAGLRCSDSI